MTTAEEMTRVVTKEQHRALHAADHYPASVYLALKAERDAAVALVRAIVAGKSGVRDARAFLARQEAK